MSDELQNKVSEVGVPKEPSVPAPGEAPVQKTDEPKEIEMRYVCGHVHKFLSPGIMDPLGVFSNCIPAPDGKYRVEDICTYCPECELILQREEAVQKVNRLVTNRRGEVVQPPQDPNRKVHVTIHTSIIKNPG